MRASLPRMVALAGLVGLASIVFAACSLGNVTHDDCTSDAECTSLFGFGSTCGEGFCSDAFACKSDASCRAAFGYGAVCEAAACKATTPDPRCNLSEPDDLVAQLGAPVPGRVVLGGMFKLQTPKERARADAARLAIREINEQGGIAGAEIGLVLCDNDVDNDAANDAAETEALTLYLGGALGVPLILGPSSSANAAVAMNALIAAGIPTLVLTPSATSSSLTDLVDRFDPVTDPFGLLWRTCPSDALQGKVLSSTIADAGHDSVVVLYQRDTYGQGLEETFRADFLAQDTKLHLVTSHPFEVDESDLQGAVDDAAAAEAPDVLLVISGDAARTVRILEMAAAQPSLAALPIFLTDGSKDQAVLLASDLDPAVKTMLANVQGTAPATPTSIEYGTFTNTLKAEFGTDASDYSFLANTYDAAYCGAFAITYAGTQRADFSGFDVAAGMSRLSEGKDVAIGPNKLTTGVSELVGASKTIDVAGTSGALDFDATTGEAPGPIEVWKPNGTLTGFVTVSVVTP